MTTIGPVGVHACLTVPAADADRLAAALADLAGASAAEPGTLLFTVHTDRDAPGTFHVFERYADDAAAAAHRGSAAMTRFRQALRELGVRPAISWLTPLDAQPPAPAPAPAPAPTPPTRVLVLTGGHRVAIDDLLAAVEGICAERGWVWAHAVHPGAQRWLSAAHAGDFDAVLLHDLPGLALKRGEPPRPVGPDPAVAQSVCDLLEHGVGVVALHHALAGWPAWDGWAHAVGGRFLYAPGTLDGADLPASGYRMTRHTVSAVDPGHPVTAGVGPLTLDDELYLAPVLAEEVRPLLRTDADLDPAGFLDTFDVVSNGASTGLTSTSPGSDLVGWETVAGRSPVVYLQPGDGPQTFADQGFRRLLGNALAHVTSPAARAAASAAPRPVEPPAPAGS